MIPAVIYFYTDRTVYRIAGPKEWHTVEAHLGDEGWKPVTPSENDFAHMRPITEEQADELNALPPADRTLPASA